MNRAQIHILDETQQDKVFVFQLRFNENNDTYGNATNYTVTNTGITVMIISYIISFLQFPDQTRAQSAKARVVILTQIIICKSFKSRFPFSTLVESLSNPYSSFQLRFKNGGMEVTEIFCLNL